MGLEEGGPSCAFSAIGRGFDAVPLENIAHGCICDSISDIGQRSLDAIATPAWILFSKPNGEVDDHLTNAGTARLLSIGVIPFVGHKSTMPAEYRVGREQCPNFQDSLVAEYLAFNGQTSALVVGHKDSLLSKLLFQYSILGSQVIDRFLLLSMDPPGEQREE